LWRYLTAQGFISFFESIKSAVLLSPSAQPSAIAPVAFEKDQTTLRQLEAILSIHKFARSGRYGDALNELSKLSFIPLDSRIPDRTANALHNLPISVQACIPNLLKVALTCLDNVIDTDGTIHMLKTKIANFMANYLRCYGQLP
jgi:hypothetical protein